VPFEPYTFDDSVARTEEARVRVPEGYYLVEIEKFDPTPADYPRTTGFFATVRILASPKAMPNVGVGGRMRDYSTIKKDAQFGLGQMLGALGFEALAKALPGKSAPTYQHHQALAGQIEGRIKGKRAVVLIADQPGNNGRAFSGIDAWSPASRWDDLSGAALVRTTPGPVPTGSTGAANGPAEDIFADLDSRI
jgi:hypothetical protein